MDPERIRVCLLWTLAVVCAVGQANAENGLFPMADGPRQRGRGGTVLGIAEDAMSINTNPAGLAFIDGRRFDWNLASFFSPVRFSDPIQPNGRYAHDKVIVAPTFGFVFETPKDILDLGPTLWKLIVSDQGRRPTSEEPANGQVVWGTDKLPQHLDLVAGGVGSRISKVRVYAYYRTDGEARNPTVHILNHTEMPKLPAGAKVIGAGVDFVWRYRAQMGQTVSKVILRCDDRKVEEELTGDGNSWNRHAMSVVLDQTFLPRQLKVSVATGGNDVQLDRVRLRVGYVLGGSYRWIKVDMEGPANAGSGIQVMEVASATESVGVDTMVPKTVQRFKLSRKLPRGGKLLQLKALYDYDYVPTKSVANILRVLLVADGHEVAHTAHSLSESPKSLPVPPADISRVPPPHANERRRWWKFGFGIFPQGGAGVEIQIKTPLFPDGVHNKSDLLFVSTAPSLAIRLGEHVAIGATFMLNYATLEQDGLVATDLDVMRGRALSGLSFSEVFSALTPFRKLQGRIVMSKATTWGFGGRLGLMVKPHKTLSFGMAYSPKTWHRDYKTKASVDFNPTFDASGLSLILPALIFLPNGGLNGLTGTYDMRIKDFQLPQWLGGGLAWTPKPWVRLSMDVKWIDWSETMSELTVVLSKGSNPDVNAIIGGSSIETSLPVGWRDQYIFAIGAEFYHKRMVFRMGYNYGRNPVKQGFETPLAPAYTQHHITLGFTYRGESVDFHLGYSLGLKAGMRDEDGTNEVSPDWDFSSSSFGPQHFLAFGFSFRF